jgi:sugar phosphate permease
MGISEIPQTKKPRVFYGWWIVLAGTFIMTLMGAFNYYGVGVFFNSIRDEFGWSAAALGASLSLARVEGGVMAPIVGYLIDRLGPRKLMLIGVLICGSGYILLSQTGIFLNNLIPPLIYFYLVFILLVQGGISAGMGNAPSAAVANWFQRKRGLAMGVMNIGVSLGGMLARPLASLITNYGWRTALLAAGGTVWVVGLPLALIVRHKPELYGYLPDGRDPETIVEGGSASSRAVITEPEVEFSVKEALRTSAFWSIAFTFSARMLVTGSVAVFLIPLLQERGMSLIDAAGVLSLMALIGLPGRVGFAWLGDHYDKRWVIAFCFVFQSAGLILFTVVGGTLGIIFFLILYSPTYSGVLPLIPALQADYFGRNRFATIRGLMAPIGTISSVGGPLLMTIIRDITNSYEPAFVVLGIANILAIVFIVITRKPKDPSTVSV